MKDAIQETRENGFDRLVPPKDIDVEDDLARRGAI